MADAFAAVGENLPAEGLAAVDAVSDRYRSNPWLLTARAACLTVLGRGAEARADLQTALARHPAFPLAHHQLCEVELISGNDGEARRLAAKLTALTPKDALAWGLRGLADLIGGAPGEAGACFQRACGIKEQNAYALAGRALAALESGTPAGEVDRWLAAAPELEPAEPIVLLAAARWHQTRGEDAASARCYRASLQGLEARGQRAWGPVSSRLARRWRLETPSPPPTEAAPEPGDPPSAPPPGMPGTGPVE